MDIQRFGSADEAGPPAGPVSSRRPGRARRVLTTVAASAILLGTGAGIGVALTGGASAAAGPSSSGPASVMSHATIASKCAKLVAALRDSGHPAAAMRLKLLCAVPLLRLEAVGGEYGQVTFQGKTSPKTLAFERGTITSLEGSQVKVTAPDGTTWTWTLLASTIYLEGGQKVKNPSLSTGERVIMGGPLVNGAYEARLVRIRPSG